MTTGERHEFLRMAAARLVPPSLSLYSLKNNAGAEVLVLGVALGTGATAEAALSSLEIRVAKMLESNWDHDQAVVAALLARARTPADR